MVSRVMLLESSEGSRDDRCLFFNLVDTGADPFIIERGGRNVSETSGPLLAHLVHHCHESFIPSTSAPIVYKKYYSVALLKERLLSEGFFFQEGKVFIVIRCQAMPYSSFWVVSRTFTLKNISTFRHPIRS